VLLGPREVASATQPASLADLVEALRFVGFGPGCLNTTKPWSVILDADDEAVVELKRELVARGVAVNDGYEDLGFSLELFDRPPLVNCQGGKVVKVSYDVRVISRQTFDAHSPQLRAPTVLLVFADQPPDVDLGGVTPRRLDVAGAGVEEIGNLLGAFS
jgi:hypothetical protein